MTVSAERTCAKCGAGIKPAMMKCIECGTRVGATKPSDPAIQTTIVASATPVPAVPPNNRVSPTNRMPPRTSASTATKVSPPAATTKTAPKREPDPPAKAEDESLITATCTCGFTFQVRGEWAGRHRKCRKCSAPVLIPDAADFTASFEATQLKQCIETAIRQLPAEPTLELKKTLASAKLKKLRDQVAEKNPLDQAEAQQRRMALIELGESKDVRALEIMATVENDTWDHVRSALIKGLGLLQDPRGLPILLRSLADRSAEVVSEGIKALRGMNSEHAVKPLLRLGLVNPHLKLYVADAVGNIGKTAVPVLLDVVQHRDRGMLFDAVILLGKIGDESAVPTLLMTVDHTAGATRAYAIEALGRIGDKRAVTKLLEQLNDQDEITQLNAIVALGKIRDPRAVRALLPFIGASDEDLCRRALDALGEIGDPRAVPAIIKMLPEATDSLRDSVIDALAKIGDVTAVDALLPLLGESTPEQQTKILLGVKKAKAASSVSILLGLLENSKPVVRRHVVDALGEIAQADTWQVISELVSRDPSFEVRSAAVKALGKIGNKQALPILERALRDEAAVRCSAVIAIGLLGDTKAAPALVAMLRDSAPEVRYHAVTALGKLGAKSALPAIQALHEDADPMVQRGVEKALEELGAEPAVPPLSKRLSKMLDKLLPDALVGGLPGKSLAAGVGVLALGLCVAAFFLFGGSKSLSNAPVAARGNVNNFVPMGSGSEVVIARSKGEVEVWNIDTGKMLKEATPGTLLLLATDSQPAFIDSKSGRMVTWDYQTSAEVPDPKQGSAVMAGVYEVQVSADGKVALLRGQRASVTWDLVEGHKLAELSFDSRCQLALSQDGKTVIVLPADLKRLLWLSAQNAEELATIPGEFQGATKPSPTRTANKCILTRQHDVLLIDRDSGETTQVPIPKGLSAPCRFLDDEHLLGVLGDTLVRISLLDTTKVDHWKVSEKDITVSLAIPFAEGRQVAVVADEKKTFWVVDAATGSSKEIK